MTVYLPHPGSPPLRRNRPGFLSRSGASGAGSVAQGLLGDVMAVALPQSTEQPHQKTTIALQHATIGFAGDSGDGMQLVGTEFANTSASLGNDISTFPDFPAEIRAPAGTLAGVSGFQIQFSSD